MTSIFERIIAREIPADVVYEDDAVIAFRDIAPRAPVHLLVVPKNPAYADVAALAEADPALLARLVVTAKRLAQEHTGGDFRLVFNSGEGVGQTVFHVHAHVMGNRAGAASTEERIGEL